MILRTVLILISFPIFATVISANQGLDGNGSSTYASRALPASAPFTALSDHYFEGRFSGTTLADGKVLVDGGLFRVRAFGGANRLVLFNMVSSEATGPIDITGFGEFTVRVERSTLLNIYRLSVERLDTSGAISYPPISKTVAVAAGTQNYGNQVLTILANSDPGGYTDLDCHFFRWKQGTPPAGTWLTPVSPVQITTSPFGLVDYEFEGNGNDTSGRGLNATINGTGAFTATTNAAPRMIQFEQTKKTSEAISLNASDIVVTGDAAITAYSWAFTSGPSTATPASSSSASTTATGGSRGEYVHTLTVTDANSLQASGPVKTGQVVVDSNGLITYANSDIGFVLGPQLYDGGSSATWPKFDYYSKSVANITGGNAPVKPPDTTLTGTVSVTNGSTAVVGTGAAFTREINQTNPGEWAYYINDGALWSAPLTIASVTDDTHLTLSAPWTGTTSASRAHSGDPTGAVNFNSFRRYWHYYDQAHTQYIMFERTQLTRFRDNARKIADSWWACDLVNYGTQAAIDANEPPREVNLLGLILRAIDGKPEYWDWIYRYDQFAFDTYVTQRLAYPSLYFGARETGYASIFNLMLARVLPNTYALYGNGTLSATTGTATDGATKRSAMRDAALLGCTRFYVRLQKPDGSWRWGDDLGWPGYYAEQVWHSAFIVGALTDMLRLMDEDGTYKSANAAAYNTIRWSVISSAAHLFLHHYNQNALTNPPTGLSPNKSRYTVYYLYDNFAGNFPPASPTIDTGGGQSLGDLRQNTAPAIHIFGPAYYYSGVAQYKTWGDEIFGSFWGAGTATAAGLNDDLFGGNHTTGYFNRTTDPRTNATDNRSSEDLNQPLQRGARYPAYRLTAPAVPVNLPPTAHAGPDKALSTGTATTTISCSGNDPEGTAVTTNMTVEFGSGLSIDTPTAATATLSGLGSQAANTTVAVKCAVTDGTGNVSWDYQTIWLNDLTGLTNNPAVTIAISGGTSQSVSGSSVTIGATIGSVTVSAASSSIAQISGGTATIATPVATGTAPSFDIGGLQNGNYLFRVMSRDNSVNTAIMPTTEFIDVRLTVSGVGAGKCRWHTSPRCQ